MLANGATNLALALNLDEDHVDENKEIKEFYESNLHCLKNCSMNLIHYDIIRNIAVLLDNTKTFDEEWKTYATEMGILDNKTLAEIKVSAYCHRDQAIFFAMDRTVRQRGTFGDIIYALLKTKRFDVLKDIEPFVRELLPKIPQRQSINSTSTIICNNENDAQEPHTIKINPTLFREQGYELNYIQQHSINSRFKNALKISSSSKMPQETVEEIKIPSAPVEEKLTVLIQHAEAEYEIAEQLSTNFSREGVIATTLSEVNDFTLYEPTNVLETVFGEVDFIVPVLSSSFIEDIYPKNYDQYLESTYAQNNRKLFTLMLDEYKRDRCFNYRVRPVIVEGMSRRLIKEPMFSIAFRLPNEVSKLIRVLKKTKELKAQQLVQ